MQYIELIFLKIIFVWVYGCVFKLLICKPLVVVIKNY